MNLTPVQVQTAAGAFVGPNADTLRAAVAGMRANDQGILISDPTKATGNTYPMTFVEYALVPAEPLLNTDCTARDKSQKLLTNWLSYVTGAGQALLPSGLIAMPDSLKAQAADAIKKVGTAAITGTCASAASAQPPTGIGGGLPAGALAIPPPETAKVPAVGSPLPASSDLPAADGSLGAGGSALPADAAARDATVNLSRAVAIPPFAGRRTAGWASTAFALLGVIGLSSLALVVTARTR
jgi:hypothetical protein